MSGIGELLENPTISRITRQEKNEYQMSHINVIDLLKRIEFLEKENKRVGILEQQIKEYKESVLELKQEIKDNKNAESALTQKISNHENEINKLKITCSELEKRIQKYEANKQSTNEVVQKTTIPVNEQKKSVKMGEIIKFGRYEGKEIEWQVLDINQKDNSALLISKYLLFMKAYNDKLEDCTWETSTLRKYLNNEFYRDTFNDEEKKRIKEEVVKNSDNAEYGTKGGNDTKDKVFLLSIDEVNKYFKTAEDRKATLTDGKIGGYWLRSPGDNSYSAACVSRDGDVGEFGDYVDDDYLGVRSALWINL